MHVLMIQDGGSHQLDYARKVPWSRRRTTRVVIAGAILIALVAGWQWGPAARNRINLLYLQRRCLRYEAPADRIIFTSDPNDYDRLLKSNSAYSAALAIVGVSGINSPPAYVWYECEPWRNFPPGRWDPGPAFLHGRRTPSGDERLIALELGVLDQRVRIYCRNFEPASFFNAGDLSRGPSTDGGDYEIQMTKLPVRLYAGQPDPSDPSAFTIRCESGRNSAIIHGRVLDNGRVILDFREMWKD